MGGQKCLRARRARLAWAHALASFLGTSLTVGAVTTAGATAGVASAPFRSSAAPTLSVCEHTDHGFPDFISATFDRLAVDVRSKSGRAAVIVEANDPGGPGPASGIATVSAWIVTSQGDGPFLNLHAMDPTHWTASFPVSRGMPSGTWKVFRVTLQDGAGNELVFGDDFGEDLPAKLQIRGVADRKKPEVLDFTFGRGQVDVRRHATTVRLRAHLTDNRGLRYPGFVSAEITKSALISGSDRDSEFVVLHRVAGTPRDGIWAGSFRVHRFDRSGRYSADLKVVDPAGNYRSAQAAPLRVRAGTDEERPTATRPLAEPAVVDVRESDGSLSISVRLRDRTSGVRRAFITLLGRAPTPTGIPIGATLHLASGTRHDGIWSADLRVPRCGTTPGPLKLRLAAFDWTDKQVALFGRDFGIQVLAGDTTDPTATLDVTGLPNRLTVTFNEAVTGLTAETAVVRRQTDNEPVPADGTWSCATGAGAVVDCATGALQTAVFTLTAPVRDAYYNVFLNPEFVLGLTDLAGNAPRYYGVPTP